jgi:ClpP class serine protease
MIIMVDDVISTKALTSEKFIKEIERLVINYDLDYMDAVVHYCEKNNIEIEAAASIIRSNIRIKAKLQDEAEELNFMQLEVDAIYNQFLKRVSEGRKLTKKLVQQVARGRVWTGKNAQQRGLVDELGGLNATVQALQKKVGVKEVVYYPQKEDDTFSNILALLDEELEGEKSHSKVQIPEDLLLYYQKYAQIKKMKGLQMRLPFSFCIY